MVNVFGGHGFIGSRFVTLCKDTIVNDRNDLQVKIDKGEILYLISTVDNYSMQVNPYIDIETNLITLMRVLEQCKGKDVVFNFASSWFVYGDTELPAKETSPCNPKGFYSITKRAAEQLIISYCETFNIKYRILRFANVLGAGDKKVSKKKNALTYLLSEIVNDRPINLYDKGLFIRDYIDVDDLCGAIALIMTKGKVNEIYNVSNQTEIDFYTIIMYAMGFTGSKSIVNEVPQADFHKIVQVKSMTMDNSKLRALGYKPNKNIYHMVKDIIRSLR
jgi:nucleoside-diphosphate-sugar epimerase